MAERCAMPKLCFGVSRQPQTLGAYHFRRLFRQSAGRNRIVKADHQTEEALRCTSACSVLRWIALARRGGDRRRRPCGRCMLGGANAPSANLISIVNRPILQHHKADRAEVSFGLDYFGPLILTKGGLMLTIYNLNDPSIIAQLNGFQL